MATTFDVIGPVETPTYEGKAAKIIDTDHLSSFWSAQRQVADARGCYVFGVRAGGGITPIYVGKATRTFRQEVFAPHKLAKYQQCLADYQRGTPVLFFLVHAKTRGATNKRAIGELEEFLIQTGVARNPDLLNIRGTKRADWSIAGVLRTGVGKPTRSASEFKRMLDLGRAAQQRAAPDGRRAGKQRGRAARR